MGDNISPVGKYSSDNSAEGTTTENNQQNTDNSQEPDKKVDKFAGKTIEQILKSYEHAESKISQQGEEIARLTDMNKKVIEAFSGKNKQTETENPITEKELSDMMTADPDKAAKTIVSMFSDLKQKVTKTETERINDRIKTEEAIKLSKAQAKLESVHSDYKDIVTSTSFKEWVRANVSPELAKQADDGENSGNPEIMSLVISNYKSSINVNSNENTNKLPPNIKGSSVKANKQVLFTFEQLKKMPRDEYARRNDEILRAYAEGRVG